MRIKTAAWLMASTLTFTAPVHAKALRLSIVQALTSGEWNAEIKAGADAAAAKFDPPLRVRTVGPENVDPPRQARIFSQEAQTAPDALIVNNIAGPVFVEPVSEAEGDGRHVVWINSAPTADFQDDFFVSADPYRAGRKVADILASALSRKLGQKPEDITGDIVVGLCIPGLKVLENRISGTREALATTMPKVRVLPTLQTNAERDRSFSVWNEAIRKTPDALAYLDACEAGQENIAKIIGDDRLSAVTVAYDSPEEIREGIKKGTVLASVPPAFFLQSYLAVHFTADALQHGTPMPKGWLKVDAQTIDSSNIDAFVAAWADQGKGLLSFYKPQIDAALAQGTADLTPIAQYDNPPK